jgi:hypothetical protein
MFAEATVPVGAVSPPLKTLQPNIELLPLQPDQVEALRIFARD